MPVSYLKNPSLSTNKITWQAFLLKVTHTVYFSSSLYIINQKPMIHRTDFHWQCICLFCGFMFTGQMALLFNIN